MINWLIDQFREAKKVQNAERFCHCCGADLESRGKYKYRSQEDIVVLCYNCDGEFKRYREMRDHLDFFATLV